MYVCEICKNVVPPNTKEIRLAVETRPVQYPNTRKVVNHRGRSKEVTVSGGTGFEIVREVVSCPECAAKHRNTA